MNLLEALKPECCSLELTAHNKDEMLHALASLMCRHPAVGAIGEEAVYRALRDREERGSTGLGKLVGLPHARLPGLKDFVIGIAVVAKGVDFEALDRKKCRLFFVILGPEEDAGGHLRALAALSRQAQTAEQRAQLLRAASATALYETAVRRLGGGGDRTERAAMRLLVLILYDEDLLYEVLDFFLEQGIEGATVIESAGMGHYISNVPIFAEFIGIIQKRKNHSKTILALVPAERETELVEGIESITGDLQTHHGAMLLTLDTVFHKGSMRMM